MSHDPHPCPSPKQERGLVMPYDQPSWAALNRPSTRTRRLALYDRIFLDGMLATIIVTSQTRKSPMLKFLTGFFTCYLLAAALITVRSNQISHEPFEASLKHGLAWGLREIASVAAPDQAGDWSFIK